MTCRPHHAACPARDGGECCCEPLTAEERAFLRAQVGLSVRRQMPMPYYLSADVLRLLHERDCLERETITTRVPCARCGQGVRPREMADGRCAECLRVERDAALDEGRREGANAAEARVATLAAALHVAQMYIHAQECGCEEYDDPEDGHTCARCLTLSCMEYHLRKEVTHD